MLSPKKILSKHLPPECADKLIDWLVQHNAVLNIADVRQSKYGDYRPPFKGQPHRISVNYDLNPFEFRITLLHEMAHLLCWEATKGKVRPHGKEWKAIFQHLVFTFCEPEKFPSDIRLALARYFQPGTGYSRANMQLHEVLKKYDDYFKEKRTG